MVEKEAEIKNRAGIHVRPSGIIMNEVSAYKGRVSILANGIETELSNIMALLSLGLTHGNAITIRVEGADEETEAQRLVELFETKFDFPGRESG